MAENTNLNSTAEAWAEIVIKNWKNNIAKLGIKDTGALLKSFYFHIQRNANGDPELIQFAFNYYGRFIDMGVGAGVSVGDVSERRQAKPWYSKEFYSQAKKLSVILAEKYGVKSQQLISEKLNK